MMNILASFLAFIWTKSYWVHKLASLQVGSVNWISDHGSEIDDVSEAWF
jgi:hypothetical protein